jgi:hypothetical protein
MKVDRASQDDHVDAPAATSSPRWHGGSPRAHWLQLGGVFCAALLSRALTLGRYVTTDERVWMSRSSNFADAVVHLHLSKATASTGGIATMPGASTMWLGSIGRLAWTIGQKIGVVDHGQAFSTSLSGLATAQVMVAITTSLLIVLVTALAYRWAGWGAAAIVGVFLAGGPWFSALGAVLHTDELTALFGIAGLLLLALAFDVPERAGLPRPVLAAAAAGALLIQSPLTKATGATYGVGAVVMLVFALVRDWNVVRDGQEERRLRVRQIGAAAGAAIVAVPLAWPAIAADPGTQISASRTSLRIADQSTGLLRNGVPTNGRWDFYLFALPLRMTPWLLVAVIVAIPLALRAHPARSRSLWLAIWATTPLLTISFATKQYDRYGLAVLVCIVVFVGVGLGPTLEQFLARRRGARLPVALVGCAVMLYAAVVAPWGLIYFDPLVGGYDVAKDRILIGWGEGYEHAIEKIQDLEDGACDDVTIAGVGTTVFGPAAGPAALDAFGVPCARPRVNGERPTYVVVYINQAQRVTASELKKALEGRTRVGTVKRRGIVLATIWR